MRSKEEAFEALYAAISEPEFTPQSFAYFDEETGRHMTLHTGQCLPTPPSAGGTFGLDLDARGMVPTADSVWGLSPRKYDPGDARRFAVRIRRGEGWDVRPEAEALDGQTLTFTFGWIAEPGERYAGERVWVAPMGTPVPWLAEGDLKQPDFWP